MNKQMHLEVQKIIPAPRKLVFEAWLDPQALSQFMKPSHEMPDCDVEVSPEEGGCFKIVMKAGSNEIPISGKYISIRRYDRLEFTWISERTIPDSTVTLVFEEHASGGTKLTLSHVGFPDEHSLSDHENGWTAILDLLAEEVNRSFTLP